MPPPLNGLRVVVTRATQDAQPLLDEITRLGAHAVHAPALVFAAPRDADRLVEAVQRIPSYDWAVFTSVHGVEAVFHHPLGRAPEPGRTRFAAIGPATRDALEARGVPVAFMPKHYLTEELAQGLPDVDGRRIVLLRAEVSNPALARILRERGADVEDVAAYRTQVDPKARATSTEILRAPPDWVLFSSPSTVQHFSALFAEADLAALQSRVSAACIGPVTSRAALDHGWNARVVAASHTIPGLLEALVREVANHA